MLGLFLRRLTVCSTTRQGEAKKTTSLSNVTEVREFVTLFVTFSGRSHGKMGVSQGIEERMRVPFFKQENEETPISIPSKQQKPSRVQQTPSSHLGS
jgi:hypothetical protein